MKRLKPIFVLAISATLMTCNSEKTSQYPSVEAPAAAKKPFEIISKHGHKRIDNYYWLKNREDTAVINYLHAENTYRDAMLAHTKDFQQKLFDEMKGRIKEKDQSAPYKI